MKTVKGLLENTLLVFHYQVLNKTERLQLLVCGRVKRYEIFLKQSNTTLGSNQPEMFREKTERFFPGKSLLEFTTCKPYLPKIILFMFSTLYSKYLPYLFTSRARKIYFSFLIIELVSQ